ncbi:MAG: tRNA (N(6)-L-threonylcarbamoyladenosine(37)-C(2))-methylthiotransferase MtaB [Acidobacteriaceae bacterium]
MTRYHVESFGCRTSQADGDAIAVALGASGAEPSEDLSQADVVVVNTCSVTAEADRDARAYIRRAQRANPHSRIVVTGCYAQRAPEEIAALPGVYAVVGNSHKNQVASIALGSPAATAGWIPLSAVEPASQPSAAPPFLLAGDIFAHSHFQLPSIPAAMVGPLSHRTRPSLKIQDGCGNRCTFCIIPSIRGNSRSLARRSVLEAVKAFTQSGGTELVISGINLGRWGRDLTPQNRFEDLLTEIFETTEIRRLRISSVEPMDWSDGLIHLLSAWGTGDHPRLARHVHMPLQSGADSVLRRMHRRYRPWHYADRAAKVRAASPDAAIGADVMVGFPGETDAEFQQSYDFIAAQPLTYLHLFPFSARPGTTAWQQHQDHGVSGVAVRERMAALRRLIDQKNLAFRSRFIGRRISAVTLIPDKSGGSSALTDNFLPVKLEGGRSANTLVSVEIVQLAGQGVIGRGVSGLGLSDRAG